MIPRALLAAAALWLPLAPGARAGDDERLQALGRHLARECTACHRIDGSNSPAIPSIVGWGVEPFVAALKSFKSKERTNPVMVSVTEMLDEAQMLALAVYFGSLERQQPAAPKKKDAKRR